jgi:hypothetical protein
MKHATKLFALLTFFNRGEKLQAYFIENHLKQLILLHLKVFLYIKEIGYMTHQSAQMHFMKVLKGPLRKVAFY